MADVIKTYKEFVHCRPIVQPNDKPRPHQLFLWPIYLNGKPLVKYGLLLLLLVETNYNLL
jgi:hypothetical protein